MPRASVASHWAGARAAQPSTSATSAKTSTDVRTLVLGRGSVREAHTFVNSGPQRGDPGHQLGAGRRVEHDADGRPAPCGAGELDRAAPALHEALGDGESQARPARGRGE